MQIRAKTTFILLVSSLTPLGLVGTIAYRNGEGAIRESMDESFQQLAYEAIDKVDRSLFRTVQDVRTWAGLDLMQEVSTGDPGGKVSSFLVEVHQEYGHFSNIDALSPEGRVAASSHPRRIGLNLKEEPSYGEAADGREVSFAFPIEDKSQQRRRIGLLVARWNSEELFHMTQIHQRSGIPSKIRLMLMKRDGLLLSAPEPYREEMFRMNLIDKGLQSARLASQRRAGSLVEPDEQGQLSLIGYASSRGYRDFPGFGWAALVIQDARSAFAPIRQLLTITWQTGILVAVCMILISLNVSRAMTEPIVSISQVARRVAGGDFEGRVAVRSRDELGELAQAFNRMVQDLKSQREQLVEKASLEKAYADLQRAQSQLVQAEKMAALGRFSSGIAHEVKNPLGIVLGGVEYLQRKLSAADADTQTALEKVKESTLRADGVVRGLLQFARPSQLKMEKVHAQEIVKESLGLLQYRGPLKGIAVHTDFREGDLLVDLDKNRMQQVLFNLLANAVEAMPSGGTLTLKTFREGASVVIQVTDTGEGIPKENLSKLFEPFFTTKRDRKGTGLGLSISKMIVENHRGMLLVESEPGKGTTFRITLPVDQLPKGEKA